MSATIPYISSAQAFDELLENRSEDRDLVVFKVSPICNMSFMAEEQVDLWVRQSGGDPGVDLHKVDVIGDRAVSQHIERVLNILHESPQILWIGSDGAVRWHGSHRAVSSDNLAAVKNGASPPAR